MNQLGYYSHYLELKRKYPGLSFDYPRDWSLKEYGTLFVYDQITANGAKRVLEVGCGYDTFFARHMNQIGVEYWNIDKANAHLGIGKNETRFLSVVAEREKLGARHVDGFLGDAIPELPDAWFDLVFSMSVIEHIDDAFMPNVTREILRILRPGGFSAHSIDVYPRSIKAKQWHSCMKATGFDVPLPFYDKWEFEGNHTTFIEQPKIRYMIYNSLKFKNPLQDGAPYVSQFATVLHLARAPGMPG